MVSVHRLEFEMVFDPIVIFFLKRKEYPLPDNKLHINEFLKLLRKSAIKSLTLSITNNFNFTNLNIMV